MDVSSVSESGQGHDVQQKAAAKEQAPPPPPPPTEGDSVQLSGDAKALASSVLAEE
jgi:hypothetical protein